MNEGIDPGHGARGAELAEKLKSMLDLTEAQLEELKHACRHHTDGTTEGSVTVRTCWDADRLDLWRVGIHPSRSRLCTAEGKGEELFEWSRLRGSRGFVPECALEWLGSFEAG